jgi:hypothetical protein
VPWWGGWAGPRVVNNVVINRNTTVNVTNITVYRNVQVTNAVVGVPREQFGHGTAKPARIPEVELRQLAPVHGPLQIKPVAASVMPATGTTVKPPAAIHARGVVATRPPHDPTSILRETGLPPAPAPAPAPAPPNVTSTARPGPAGPAPAIGAPQRPVPAPTSPAPRGPEGKVGGVPERPMVPPPSGPAKVPPPQGAVPPPQHPAAPGSPGGQGVRGQQRTGANQPPLPPAAEHQARRAAPPRGQPEPHEGSGQGERQQR